MIETLASLDQKILLALNSWNAPWMNPIMVFLSGQLIWFPFVLLILFISYKQMDRRSLGIFVLFLLLGVIASDVTASYLLKNFFERLRPCKIPELKLLMNNFGQKCGGKFGFVSSHAANSFVILTLAFNSLKSIPKFLYAIWLLPIAVSFSRIYLGVHYPGDILGGVVVGTSWGLILTAFYKRRRLGSEPS